MKRVLTAVIAAPLAIAAVFVLPGFWFLVLLVAVMELAAWEYVRLARHWAPGGPLWVLLLAVPLAAWCLGPGEIPGVTTLHLSHPHIFAAALLILGIGTLVVVTSTPVAEGAASLGLIAFGVPYLALPAAAVAHLQARDPWLIVLLVAVVWLGDTAAYYVGRAVGRHKMSPRISPNKTWEGAAASLSAAVLAAMVWSYWYLGTVVPAVVVAGVLAGLAAVIGDLVESLLKRGAGVKDSGSVLPGHGGVLDRLDALMFAAPMFLIAVHFLGERSFMP